MFLQAFFITEILILQLCLIDSNPLKTNKTLIVELTIGVAMFLMTLAQEKESKDIVPQENKISETLEQHSDDEEPASAGPELSIEARSYSDTAAYIAETEEIVDNYFSDIPIMSDIAYCESRYRQYDSNGGLLRGIVNNSDVGIMQINEYYHLEDSQRLGVDIHTVDGNMEFARHLYNTQGVQPWKSSSHCWNEHNIFALK